MEDVFNVKMAFTNLVKLNAGHVCKTVYHVLILNFAIFVRQDFCLILKLELANKSIRFYVTQQPLFYHQINANNAQSSHTNPIMFVIHVF